MTVITRISPICFRGKIIDAHAHTGFHEERFNKKTELDVFVKSALPNNDTVEKMLVSDLDVLKGTKDEYNGNKELISTFEKDSKYALFASCNPKSGNIENIKKLIKENPNSFIGLKFHPFLEKLELDSKKLIPYMEYADKFGLPCLFHTSVITDGEGKLTGEIEKYSDPELVYKLAKKYKKTPIVMAHLGAGWRDAHDKAIDILVESVRNGDANLYADISWVDIDADMKNSHTSKDHILNAIKRLKGIGEKNWSYGDQSFRLIFGSDAPLGRFNSSDNKDAVKDYTKFIDDIKYAIKTDKDLKKDSKQIIEDLFYNNANKLYLSGEKKSSFNDKKISIYIGTIIGTTILMFLLCKNLLNKKKETEQC